MSAEADVQDEDVTAEADAQDVSAGAQGVSDDADVRIEDVEDDGLSDAEKRAEERVITPDTRVLIIDRSSLHCVEATISDYSKTGCCITCEKIRELPAEISLRIDEEEEMIPAKIIWRRNGQAGVTFMWEEPVTEEQRRETRTKVLIPATVSNLNGSGKILCAIRDASKSGCRIVAEEIDQLQNEILIDIKDMGKPVKGRIMWRRHKQAGVKLLWKMASKAKDDDEGAVVG